METLLWIILSPLALVIGLIVSFAFGIGFYVMMNMFKAGKLVGVDYSNWLGRTLGFVQLSKQIPRLMRAVFVWGHGESAYGQGEQGMCLLDIPPGIYTLENDVATRSIVEITRPMLNMNRQDLMEQLDFRPEDGKVDGRPI